MTDSEEINGIRTINGLTLEDLLEEMIMAMNDIADKVESIEAKVDMLMGDDE